MSDKYTPRMRSKYDAEIVAAMQAKFGYKNVMEIPRIEKITLNMGVGEASQDKKKVTTAAAEMELIAGRSLSSPRRRSPSRSSSCVKACRSVARSPCAANACMNSSTV